MSKGLTTTIIVVLCIAAVVGVDIYQRNTNKPLTSFDPNRAKGNPDAALAIIEFSDFPCPHCAQGSKVIRMYMKKYPDGIFFVKKYFPLNGLNSNISAVYAECAARQEKFWPFHDRLFDNQSQWRTAMDVRPFFHLYAKGAGLDKEELEVCVGRNDVAQVIKSEKMMGEAYAIQSTPTYFVNEEMIVGVKELEKVLIDFFETE